MTNKKSWKGEVDLNPGDLIEIFRTGYKHWGVYVGSGDVVHLALPSKYAGAGAASFPDRAEVKKEPLSKVVGTDRYHVNNKHDKKYHVRTPDQIVRIANNKVGQIVKYEITTQNCEHFANSLRYNVSRSDQVTNVAWIVAIGAIVTSVFSAILRML